MANNLNFRYKHLSSSVNNSTPTNSELLNGEIAVNTFAGNEKLFIKNTSGDVVEFKPSGELDKKLGSGFTGANSAVTVTSAMEDQELVISSALNDLNTRINEIPTANNARITITINGATAGTFTVNADTDMTIDLGNVGLPTVSAEDNGKVLMVVNGVWTLVNLSTIYTGTGIPSSSQGNDGDIYLQITN